MEESTQVYAVDPQVLGLVFAVRQGQVELSDVRQVEMRIPPSATIEERAGVTGARVEIQDADGAWSSGTICRLPVGGAELFSEDRYGEILRVHTMPGTPFFSVLAPALAPSHHTMVLGAVDRSSATTAYPCLERSVLTCQTDPVRCASRKWATRDGHDWRWRCTLCVGG